MLKTKSTLAALSTIFLLASPAHAAPQTLDAIVNNWVKSRTLVNSSVGVEIMELPTGKVLCAYNGNRCFTPASTAKVFTTAYAFETLGSAYVYKTQLLSSGQIAEGKLHGDLIINPSQDPSFSRDDLRQLTADLVKKNIKSIDGGVKLNPVVGGNETYMPSWLVEDFGQVFMPVCSNFVIDRNVAQGTSGLHNAKVIKFDSTTEFNALNTSLMRSDVASAWLTYDPNLRHLNVFCGDGTTPKSPLCVSDPDYYNIALTEATLSDHGVKIEKPGYVAKNEKLDAGATLLAEHTSKPLSNIITTTLHESDNLYAQQLLRTVGLLAPDQIPKAKAKVDDRTSIEDRGLYRMRSWLGSIGVPLQEAVLFDGCGLTRKNGVSPHALNMVLKHMATENLNGPYLSLLKNGDKYRYKTGSMDTVRTITGVVQTVGGQTMAVTLMVNCHTQSVKDIRPALNELVSIVASIATVGKTTTSTVIPVQAASESGTPTEITRAVVHNSSASKSSRGHSRRRTRR